MGGTGVHLSTVARRATSCNLSVRGELVLEPGGGEPGQAQRNKSQLELKTTQQLQNEVDPLLLATGFQLRLGSKGDGALRAARRPRSLVLPWSCCKVAGGWVSAVSPAEGYFIKRKKKIKVSSRGVADFL